MSNTRNAFVVDIPENDPDMEDLRALKKVRDAISKKKKEIKEKDWNQKHPSLVAMVEAHRRRKIITREKNAEGKIVLDVMPPEKPNVDIDETPKTKKVEIQIQAKEIEKPKEEKKEAPKPEKEFNRQVKQVAAPPPGPVTVDKAGRWFS